jgi:CHAT domain-containing protein
LIISAGLTNDDFLLNKTLLDIKKFLSVSKGKNQSLVAIKNSFPILSIFYRNKLLHKELENLVTFLENNFKIKTSGELTPLEAQEAFFYLTAKSEVAKFKQNYKDAQKHLDTLIKISDFDIPVILKEIQNDKNSVSYLQSVLITETLPELFYLYNKNSDYEKMKALTRIALRQELDDLSKRNLKDILVVNNQMKILNALFDYYKGNKKKQLMVANFIYDNLDEISKTKTFGYTPIFAEDFLENIEEYYSINEKELFNKIFEVANQKILENYNDPIFSSVWKSSKNDVNLVLKLLKSAELSNDEFLINKAYTTAQVIKNANDTRDIIKGYLAKSNVDNNDLNLYHNLQKEIISLTKYEEASLLINASNLTNKSNQDLFNKKFEKIRASLSEVEDKLKNKNPEIFEPIKLRGVNINSIQSKLYENQAVLDYYFSQNELAIVIIKKNSFKVHFDNINNIQTLKNNIRNTLQISKTGALIPFDVKSAFKFNEIVFLNIEKYLQNIDFIYVIPSGPLNEIPLHVLPTTNSENCKNCSLIKWNLSNYTFNYLTSLENFAGKESKDFLTDILENNFKKVIKDFSLDKNFEIIKNLGNEMFGNIFKSTENKKNTEKMSNTYTYLGVGDPDLYVIKVQDKTKDKKITIDLDRFALLRSSNLRGFDNSLNIKNFYAPVEGSRKEIIETSKMLGETNSTIWLKGDATETKIKDNNLKNYNIIHFATHAEVSGAMQGLNEPFLVLTPPNEKTDKDNGLLMMNEIMQLNLNADLVLLSACNTGSTEDQYSGSYSGLAKAFFVAGAKSVLVSNWMVEDAATQKLILKFIDNSSRTRKSFAENLNLTMRELSNQNDQFSHPIFWAPFVFVGQDRVVNSPL